MDNEQYLRELVEKAKNYDAEAFGQLYDLYFDKIFGYAYYKVGKRFDAEDIAEQVFLKALEKIPEFQWRGVRFSSWLFRIASNLIIDYYRAGNREMVEISEEANFLLDDTCDPERSAINACDRDEIVSAMRTLTEEQRQVVIMRFIAGMTNEEVAKAINKNIGAVKALQHRAIGALSRSLGRDSR